MTIEYKIIGEESEVLKHFKITKRTTKTMKKVEDVVSKKLGVKVEISKWSTELRSCARTSYTTISLQHLGACKMTVRYQPDFIDFGSKISKHFKKRLKK